MPKSKIEEKQYDYAGIASLTEQDIITASTLTADQCQMVKLLLFWYFERYDAPVGINELVGYALLALKQEFEDFRENERAEQFRKKYRWDEVSKTYVQH